MNRRRLIGVLLVVIGIVVLIAALRLTNASGHWNLITLYYIAAGLLCASAGLADLLFGQRLSQDS